MKFIATAVLLTLVLLDQGRLYFCFVELASIGVAIGSAFMGSVCYFRECCSAFGIPANFTKLEEDMRARVYGQSIAQEIIVNALRSHWNERSPPQKALTLSFHGWPGGGKNYVTKFIIDSLYKEGSNSKFVHHFIGRLHFPREHKVEEYQNQIREWLMTNVSKCERQLFVFDEVDKMPPKVLNALKPMIDYRDNVGGKDFRRSVFIFLSNTGADVINRHYLDLWQTNGVLREDLKLKDFEHLITRGAFNEEGGFHHSDTIASNLIDHYVPFLPMERQHVKMCIVDEFKQRHVPDVKKEHIDEAMEFVDWAPEDSKLFSKTGCKRISQKVGMIVAKYDLARPPR